MNRRDFLRLMGCGLAAAALPGALRAAEAPARPNIILFLVDDMGWQDTSLPFFYKGGKAVATPLNRRYRTPNMEAMARDGMLFTDAYACPICSPSRCSLMSGMNAARHRVTDWTLNVDDAARLKTQGNGTKSPVWAANGLQPAGTQPSGTCLPPWRIEDGKFVRPTDPASRVAYRMTVPYTNALTFPELLRENGYYTVHCGKAHWGSGSFNTVKGAGQTTPGADPRNFGFDVNIAGCEIGGPSNYRGDRRYGNNPSSWVHFGVPGLDENGYYDRNVFLTDALTDQALRALDAHLDRHDGRPFYLYMAHYAIHSPWGSGQAWDAKRAPGLTDPKDGLPWNEVERNYAALIMGMDDSLGAIRKFLDERGIADNTIVIFMSDNGGNDGSANARMKGSNAPLRGGKGSCYEGGIREPMMVVWPGKVKPATVCSEPVHLDDFYPTILGMAGVPLPSPDRLAETPAGVYPDGPLRQVLDGQSLVPVLTGERATVNPDGSDRLLLWHYPNQWGEGGGAPRIYHYYTVLRRGPWKLIYNHNDGGNAPLFELYNLTDDIGEAHDLASARPDLVDSLRRDMARLLRDRRAQMPLRLADGKPVPYPDDVPLPKPARK